jgi:hypothetical protein
LAFACPHCGFTGPSLEAGTCGRCGVIFAKAHVPKSPEALQPQPESEASPELLGEFAQPAAPPSPRPQTQVRWALPLAFAVGLLLNSNGCGRLVVYSSASNWAHELGHASWRWLNGRSAVPALFFTFYSQPGRSFIFTVLVLGGLAALFLLARSEECRGLMALATLFFLCFVGLLALPAAKEHLLESFAGLFGEFWISTLWVILFYYRFPSALRWERLRWAFLFLGACAYVRIVGVFWVSRADMTLLPWGSFFGGDGDLERLLAGGWLVPTIRHVYVTTAAVCGAVIGLHYVYFLWQPPGPPKADWDGLPPS